MFLEMARGFQTNTTEIVLILVVVLAFILTPVIYGTRKRRRQERRRRQQASERYERLVREYGLSPGEQGEIEILSEYLENPEKKYLVMRNQSVFNQTARLALDDGAMSEGQITSLRVRLGFSGEAVGAHPRSSAEIPPDSAVLILEGDQQPVHARVIEPTTSAFRVRLDDNERAFVIGNPVEVIYQNSAGMFQFDSAVLKRESSELHLEHSERIESVQRRKFYRREMHLPLYVNEAGTASRPIRSRFVDLGGGGAGIVNPGERFSKGDTLQITFHPDSDETLHIPATVVRTSKGGKLLHLKFDNIRESSRDKIYRMLFQQDAQGN